MNTSKIFIILLMPFLSACSTTKKSLPGQVGLVTLKNYFVKNNVSLPDQVNYMTFTNQADFDRYFGMAKTADNTVVSPDFNGQIAVGIALASTNKKSTIQFEKAEIGGSELNVYYTIAETGIEETYTMTPAAVATVPKSQSVKRVNFYQHSNKMKTLPLKF